MNWKCIVCILILNFFIAEQIDPPPEIANLVIVSTTNSTGVRYDPQRTTHNHDVDVSTDAKFVDDGVCASFPGNCLQLYLLVIIQCVL